MKPATLFHATWPSRIEGIAIDQRVRPGVDGCVYLANKPEYAAGFLRLRGGEFVGVIEVELDGRKVHVPDYVPHDHVFVVEISVARLESRRLGVSSDHSPLFFPDDLACYAYRGPIPRRAITRIVRYDFVADDI